MKKLSTVIGIFTLLMTFVISTVFVSIASAEGEGNLMFSAQSNCIWVLNKSERKMIFLKFEKPDSVWKSNQVTVPVNFNLDKCEIKAVGSRGGSVFLYDKSLGMITIYKVNKDHSVESYMVVKIEEDFR
jgi:hypothetical protein